MKKLARFIFDVSVIVTLSYMLFSGIKSGEIFIGAKVIKHADQPFFFTAGATLIAFLAIAWLGLLLSGVISALDVRVRRFGGSYNPRTLGAVLKDAVQFKRK